MASFTSYDFSETMARAEGFTLDDVEYAEGAWGNNGDYAEWAGGFLVRLKDGRFGYVTGWCDTTGWGCQDGVETIIFDSKPILKELPVDSYFGPAEWELDPVDLNRLIRGEIKTFDNE